MDPVLRQNAFRVLSVQQRKYEYVGEKVLNPFIYGLNFQMNCIYSIKKVCYDYFECYFQCNFNFLLHYGYIEGIVTVVMTFPETQLDIVLAKESVQHCCRLIAFNVNFHNTLCRCIHFLNVRYTLLTRAHTSQNLVFLNSIQNTCDELLRQTSFLAFYFYVGRQLSYIMGR